MKSPLRNIPKTVLLEMPYAKGGEAFEDHLFGPDYDDNGKIRKLGGTGLDGYMIHPETGETIGVEAGLHSKDFQQGRTHLKDGKWSATSKDPGFHKYLNNLKLEDSDKVGAHNHLEDIYGHDFNGVPHTETHTKERVSRTKGTIVKQNYNPSGTAKFRMGDTLITGIDTGEAVAPSYKEKGKDIVMIDGIGASHTGDHDHLNIPHLGDMMPNATMRFRHKEGKGAIGLTVPKKDYVPHPETQTREGMISHFANQGFKFSRNKTGVKRSHLQNSGYAGPTDHLHILEDE